MKMKIIRMKHNYILYLVILHKKKLIIFILIKKLNIKHFIYIQIV